MILCISEIIVRWFLIFLLCSVSEKKLMTELFQAQTNNKWFVFTWYSKYIQSTLSYPWIRSQQQQRHLLQGTVNALPNIQHKLQSDTYVVLWSGFWSKHGRNIAYVNTYHLVCIHNSPSIFKTCTLNRIMQYYN